MNVCRSWRGVDSVIATDDASRSVTICTAPISDCENSGGFVVTLEPALDEYHPPFFCHVAVLLEGLWKYHHLDAAPGIVQRNDAHAIASPGLQRAHGRDDTADGDVFARLVSATAGAVPRHRVRGQRGRHLVVHNRSLHVQLGGRLGAIGAQRLGIAIHRMPAPVQAKCVFLVLELIDFRPWGRDRQRHGPC